MVRRRTYAALPLAPDPWPAAPLVLPWACVVSDNDRFIVVYGENRLSPKYRTAKQQIAQRAALYWRRPMLDGEVHLLARFYFPDARKRDAGNYRKALTDALTGVIYADDSQLAGEHYLKGAIDRTNPRVEVTLALTSFFTEEAA